jgi:Ser/Thr protein kinase RdoA (MazF antagonist)
VVDGATAPVRNSVKTDNDLDKTRVAAFLREAYDLPVTGLEFTPKGEAGYCYLGQTDGGKRFFVKLFEAHRGEPFAFSLQVSRQLHDAGYEHALPPILTTSGEPFTTFEGYAVAVFPYVEGVSLFEDEGRPHGDEVSDEEFAGLGSLIGGLHAATARVALNDAPRERFDFHYADLLRAHLADACDTEVVNEPVNDYQRELLALWADGRENLRETYARFVALQEKCRATERPFVITHGDCHLANVLRDDRGQYHLIDWSDALLAPPERDLTFYTGDADRFAAFLDVYMRAYDPGALDVDVFAFYVYLWSVQEIGSYTHRILHRNPGGANPDASKASNEQNESDLAEFKKYMPVREGDSLAPYVDAIADTLRRLGVRYVGG